ncbi:Lon protease 1 [uncultured Desulfobacterium sp.]|uniref:Lon protease n=1 Tax=uncultured Desulfobacterium sp. TaxID=201089 RepID=A0A445MRG7_9BACT|nr:Lon protease 1 [uncultured Desulfobacterium sp.]
MDDHTEDISKKATDDKPDEADKTVLEVVLASDSLPDILPLMPLTQRPAFPGMLLPVMLPAGPLADAAYEAATSEHKSIGLVLTKEPVSSDAIPQSPELYGYGAAAKILKSQKTEKNDVQMLLTTLKRFRIRKIMREGPAFLAAVQYYDEPRPEDDDDETHALALAILGEIKHLATKNPLFSEEMKLVLSQSASIGEPGRLADMATSITTVDRDMAQKVLEAVEIKARMRLALTILKKEHAIVDLQEEISKQIEDKVGKHQREFFLREQLKAIKKELGLEQDEKSAEITKFKKRIEELQLNYQARRQAEEELNKLSLLEVHSPEFGVSRNYLEWLTSLPWGRGTEDSLDIKHSRRVLDKSHAGLDDIKERIIEFIAVGALRKKITGSILCFVGPPGVGKTSLGRAIAEGLGRKFYRFSLGGMRDEAEIKGHRRTYIGALPGKLIQALKSVESHNPVIMLDEVDKIGSSYQGDPASALLEVLDPEQNVSFVDHYLDVPYDLSQVFFICTANVMDTIPAPLLDRMEVIRLAGYIMEEKIQIGKRFIVPKQLEKSGLTTKDVEIGVPTIRRVIVDHAREAGVRGLEKAIGKIFRKIATKKAEGDQGPFVVTPKDISKYLGRPVFSDDLLLKTMVPGVANGLAWTALGGSVLTVEAMIVGKEKSGMLQTGKLGEVMVESSKIAYSYITGNLERYVSGSEFPNWTIHLHVPAGATPKDGPSAGVTMSTSLLSLAAGIPVQKNLAMTGELTLTGRVLPVGGIREKVTAAKRMGITDIIIPKANKADIDEVPQEVRRGIKFHTAEWFDDVVKIAFSGKL